MGIVSGTGLGVSGEFYVNNMDNQLETVRCWIQDIFTEDFDSIILANHEDLKTNASAQIDFNPSKIKKINNEGDEIVYTDGMKYFGSTNNEVPEGKGQVILPSGRILFGNFYEGRLRGTVRDIDPEDGSIMEVTYCNGVPHGTYRHKRMDGQFLSFGRFSNGSKTGVHLVVGTGGNSYYFGQVDKDEKLNGEVIYLYPCSYKAIVGHYKCGRLTSGNYRTLMSAAVESGFLELKFEDKGRREVRYDPPTFMRISRDPLITDEYEGETVYVKESTTEGAGEGLFASRKIFGGELVSVFSGSKIIKDSNRKSIKYGDEEWSDFRLTLDKSVDLDIFPEYQLCSEYRASLGHKACHSFEHKNSVFREFEHPRFGRVMSVVAVRDIELDEEVFVSYNYCVSLAPPWYQEIWFRFCINRGWDKDKIEDWVGREVAKFGIAMEVPDFVM